MLDFWPKRAFCGTSHRGGKIASDLADYALPRLRPLRLFSRKRAAEFSLALRHAVNHLIWPAIPAAESSGPERPRISDARRVFRSAQEGLGRRRFFLLPRREQRHTGDGCGSAAGRRPRTVGGNYGALTPSIQSHFDHVFSSYSEDAVGQKLGTRLEENLPSDSTAPASTPKATT